MCGSQKILPQSHILQDDFVLNTAEFPIASRGSCDVYEGLLNGSKVCIKRLRVYSVEGPKDVKRVGYQYYHLSAPVPDKKHRTSVGRPWCGNVWCIQTSFLFWVSPSLLSNPSRPGCLARSCRNILGCIQMPIASVL